MGQRMNFGVTGVLWVCGLMGSVAMGQVSTTTTTITSTTTVSHPDDVVVLVPQSRRHVWVRESPIKLDAVAVNLNIDGQLATTEIELTVSNPNAVAREAELLLPVPDGATVRSLQYDGTGPEPTAKLLPRDEARRIYDSIVSSMRDPALLEFAGMNVIRTSAFPVPPGAKQKLRITYEQLLPSDGGRVDWVMPRTESLGGDVPWSLNATIKSARPISTVYSASHELTTQKDSATQYRISGTPSALKAAGSLRLTMLMESGKDLVATMTAYPDPTLGDGKGGFFTVLIGLPSVDDTTKKPVKREMTLVLDRSGSMRGEKFEQARLAAENVLNGLNEGESFNIIDYSDSIAMFSPKPIVKTKETHAQAMAYLKGLQPNGGTNLRDAVMESLRPTPEAGSLPLVLFLTDGLPTVGERNEVRIRESIKQGNSFGRRLYTFGVGWDVNTPLLSALARGSRAVPTFVTPDENIEQKVSQVFKRLSGPVLSSPKVSVIDASGQVSTTLAREILPGEMWDVFEGEQIVLVGQYSGGEKLKLRLEGQYYGDARTFDFEFDLKTASSTNAYVPRLWAQRKIAMLIDTMRNNYAEKPMDPKTDPAAKELIDEIVRLSTRYGILTEHTAFLATEPQRALQDRDDLRGLALRESNTHNEIRAGGGAVQQESKSKDMAETTNAPAAQYVYLSRGGQLERRAINNVMQVRDQAYFFRNNRWVEGRMVDQETQPAQVTYVIGTPEYAAFVEELIKNGYNAVLSLDGDVYLSWNGQRVLMQNILPANQSPKP